MYGFFMRVIREKTSFQGNPHPLIRDLIELTHTEAYLKILEGGLSRLPPEAIIMIKANDVICEAFRIPKKKPKLVDLPPDIYNLAQGDPDPYQRMVLKEDMKKLDTLLKDADRDLIEKLVDEVPSKDIRADLEITLTALTSRIYRLRKRIQQHLIKGY